MAPNANTLQLLLWPGALAGWPLELGCRMSCGQGICPSGHSLGQEREEEQLMQWGSHRSEHLLAAFTIDTAQSCSQGTHLGHTTCTPGLRGGTGLKRSPPGHSVLVLAGSEVQGQRACCHWQVRTLLFQFFQILNIGSGHAGRRGSGEWYSFELFQNGLKTGKILPPSLHYPRDLL